MVRTMPYIQRPLNETRKYILVDAFTGEEDKEKHLLRWRADRAQGEKQKAGEWQWRVRAEVTRA